MLTRNVAAVTLATAFLFVATLACTTTTDGKEVVQVETSALDAVLSDYALWLAENPTAPFDEYKPHAISQILSLAGVDAAGDPTAALLEWLGDTPVSATALLVATGIVKDNPQLVEYRVYIAQLLMKLGQ